MKGRTAFHERVGKALEDSFLRRSVRETQDRLREGRVQAAEDWGDWEALRSRGEAIRRHTVENLDVYLDRFATRVEEAGGRMFFADTAEEARRYILRLAAEKGVSSVVKSKSMVSEEIGLNQALEERGVEVTETDLGEYIIQLAGEKPSHIIAPAIHKNRKQVARLFSREAGRPLSEETEELTAYARRRLREKFLRADMGITGCNFGVAESGSVVLVSNEGNARLTSTLPRIHVVVMGMERLVPRWEDLDVLLTLLTRSATGQKITSYVTAITGPRRSGDADGPEELHIVVVDNGRSDLLGTKYQQILHCIRCGACLNVCPVYRHIGGHAYGSVYSGPIGAVLTPLLNGFEKYGELPYASSLCGACTEACPVRIPLHDMLLELRRDQVKEGRRQRAEQMAFRGFAWITEDPKRFSAAARLGHWLTRPLAGESGRLKKGPGPLSAWTESRDFPRPAPQSFRDWWRREGRRGGGSDDGSS
ncbi:MAG: LutB/LldF family L-lactate oxidation iron-sulfur protein [Planifilum fimeticola]